MFKKEVLLLALISIVILYLYLFRDVETFQLGTTTTMNNSTPSANTDSPSTTVNVTTSTRVPIYSNTTTTKQSIGTFNNKFFDLNCDCKTSPDSGIVGTDMRDIKKHLNNELNNNNDELNNVTTTTNTPRITKPSCVNIAGWKSQFGPCSTYAKDFEVKEGSRYKYNNNYACEEDVGMNSGVVASKVCSECNKCE